MLEFSKVHSNGKVQKTDFSTGMEKYKKRSYKKFISLNNLRLLASNKRSFKKQPSKKRILKKNFVPNIKMENLTLDELKIIVGMEDIRGNKSMSKERLIMNQSL